MIVGWTLAVGYRQLLATRLCFSAAICLQGVIIFADFSPSPPEHTTLTLLAVGHGDSILIELMESVFSWTVGACHRVGIDPSLTREPFRLAKT